MKEIFVSDIVKPVFLISLEMFFSIPCRLGCITKPRKEADAWQY